MSASTVPLPPLAAPEPVGPAEPRSIAIAVARGLVAFGLVAAAGLFAASHPASGGWTVGVCAVTAGALLGSLVVRPSLAPLRLVAVVLAVGLTVATAHAYQRAIGVRAHRVSEQGGHLLWLRSEELAWLQDRQRVIDSADATEEARYAAMTEIVERIRARGPGWPHAVDVVAMVGPPELGVIPHAQAAFTCGQQFLIADPDDPRRRIARLERRLLRADAEATAPDFDELGYVAFWEAELDRLVEAAGADADRIVAWWAEVTSDAGAPGADE